MWNGGTEADEGWEGVRRDGDEIDVPIKKLHVPKTAPDFSPHLKKMCVPPYRPDFSHLNGRKLFYRTVYYGQTMIV